MRLIFSSQKIVETVDLVTFTEEILNGNFIFCAPSVEKHCFVALDVKLQVKVRIKTFHWLLEFLHTALALKATTKTACFLKIFAYPSNRCLIYGSELNL